jgi:Tol biopolymer transport system component
MVFSKRALAGTWYLGLILFLGLGGTIVLHTIFSSPGFAMSADGKWLAILRKQLESNVSTNKNALVPLDAGPNPPVRLLDPDLREGQNPQFTPDGGAIVYPIPENGVVSLWLQPLDGSRGRQITAFETDVVLLHDTSALQR